MTLSVAADLIEEAKQQAFNHILDVTLALIDTQLGTDAEAFGDSPLDRGQRIARFLDMAERGLLDTSPLRDFPRNDVSWTERFVTQFKRDLKESGLVSPIDLSRYARPVTTPVAGGY